MHTNQKLLVDYLISKGASYTVLDEYEELLEIKYKNKKDFLYDRFSSEVPFHSIKLTADKFFTKKILTSNNIATPEGNIFTSNTYYDALKFAEKIFPVVLKPNWGSHGDFVYVDINSTDELIKSLSLFYKEKDPNEPFIIEQFYPWPEYRLFITHLGDFAVINREWSFVLGDGKKSIQQLVHAENYYRKHLKETVNTSLCPIILDEEVFKFLHKNNKSIDYVPKIDEKVYLRQESNLAKGGLSINTTEKMPQFFKELALNTLSCFPGLKLAGLDVLCNDIFSPNPQYQILDINSNPGLTMHHYPAIGKAENVAKMVADVMFPNWFEK